MRNFGSRLDKIEKGRGKAFAFLIRDENETQEDAIARYRAKHGNERAVVCGEPLDALL
ncbi:hypothetical protein [uncultured Parasphingorhabdus sp.]|uniref:hypothetical protein n=1 Tax=uncultured Parasphingorhabdus sp. TaxID=2709694 RepID=UPI0030D7B382|tara:strand:+ start:32663 stop:32836 length:174 start_codon:yes stop_codon:yes gene_type:complete